jgi:hypothetical protein
VMRLQERQHVGDRQTPLQDRAEDRLLSLQTVRRNRKAVCVFGLARAVELFEPIEVVEDHGHRWSPSKRACKVTMLPQHGTSASVRG